MSPKTEPAKIEGTRERVAGEGKEIRGKSGAVLFPRSSLNEALRVPQTIWDNNAGNPYPIIDIAKKLNYSPTTGNFRELLRSSQRYGLTNGTYSDNLTTTISLTSLGNSIVAPQPDEDVSDLKRRALETPDLFRSVFGSIQGKVIPPADSLKNLLIRTHGLSKEDAERCYEVLDKNIKELGIAEDHAGKPYLRLDKLGILPATISAERSPAGEEVSKEDEGSKPESEGKGLPRQEPPKAKLIFVAHGKNKKPLEQLKTILTQFKVPFEVAIDEPHKGRAISGKVIELMKQCTSGIFIFTGDEETTDSEGKKVLRPSDNVVFELGAGIMQYGDKIVIFREEGVDFGSDFTSYGHITFEKNKLDAVGLDLMKELISQGFLQVTPS